MHSLIKRLQKAMCGEHTSYKSTKKYLKKLPTSGEHVIQGPGENAGIVDIGGGYALAFRIESHNHPSYIHPFEGAATGAGGILRDIFTMGARPIALNSFFRVSPSEKGLALLDKIVKGVSYYGNTIGVPVVGGDTFLDKTYEQNPLVNVAAYGIIKKENIIYANVEHVGAEFIYVGAKTGRDGIGGAEMASESMKESVDENTVQTSDPFLGKLLLESCCELSESGLIDGMQDMGAAGLLCSTAEMVERGHKKFGKNFGAKIDLRKVPKKFDDMTPEELLLSETQERMMIVAKKENREKIFEIFKKWDLEVCVIGTVTEDGHYTLVTDEGKISSEYGEIFPDVEEDWEFKKPSVQSSEYVKAPKELVESIWKQYDWMVGTRTKKGPNKSGFYSVLDIPEIGKEIVISWSSDEGKSHLNAKSGIEYAFMNCLNSMQELNAAPLGLANCLNFGHPKDSMNDFSDTLDKLSELCIKHNVPVVGGNVSLYNSYDEKSIKPTPVLVMVGVR